MKTSTALRAGSMYVLLVVVVAMMLLPFLWVFAGSFKTQGEFLANPGAWFPASFAYLQNYVVLFTERGFGGYLMNSLIVSIAAVAGNLVFSSMAGYALAKLSFRGRKAVFVAVIGAMTVPYVAIFVPQFLIIVQLKLIDTLAAIIIPVLVMPIAVFIMRQFATAVPEELLEAARLEGAGEFRIFFTIFLPIVGPALATVGILTFMYSWNYFLWPLLVAQSSSTYTLPVGLAVATQTGNTTEFGVLLAGAMVVLIPVLVVFLFFQRFFIQSVATTGLK